MNRFTTAIVVGAGIFASRVRSNSATAGTLSPCSTPGPYHSAGRASTDISKVVRWDHGADDVYGSGGRGARAMARLEPRPITGTALPRDGSTC